MHVCLYCRWREANKDDGSEGLRNQFLSFNRIQQREQRIRELQLLLQLDPSRAGEYKRALVELLRSPVRISSNADGVGHETGKAEQNSLGSGRLQNHNRHTPNIDANISPLTDKMP